MRKLEKTARQSPETKPEPPRPDEMRAPRVPFEPVPLHVPVQVPQQDSYCEESISSPRGVVIIDYGSD